MIRFFNRNMFQKGVLSLMYKGLPKPPFHVPKRQFAQVGSVVIVPPREHISYGEKLCHIAFMYIVWLAPVLYWSTQIKVWRRLYIES